MKRWILTLAVLGVAATGCRTPETRGKQLPAEPGPIPPQVAEIDEAGPVSTVEGDQEQIKKSLETMDPYEDRTVPRTKMEGLVRDGLYDPENENPLEIGTMAPDFALQPLRFYDFRLAMEPVTKDNAGRLFEPVRLSEFRGKRPVVLVFGSYT